jgi:signal transduction histidine kinase/CheY-like chemotaxis protein
MAETKTFPKVSLPGFGTIESRIRDWTLNVALIIGTLTTVYFGIHDVVLHRTLPALASLLVVIIFGFILLLNILIPRLREIIDIGFVVLVGSAFLALMVTQFPAPTIVFWCFTFPLLALFLLGRNKGVVALLIYNLGVIGVFAIDSYLPAGNYTYEYSIRYCGVMIVISMLSYYYEASRARSHAFLSSMNQSLEQRVKERTRALEESQDRLRQAEKLEAIGLLAGGIAHDFNNQLTGIMAFADLIRINAKDNAETRNLAESIIACSRRSADLTGQLLAFARKGNLLTVPVDLHHIVADVISLLKHTIDKRITLRQELIANPSTILGDPAQLENALLNLALNSRDAMPAGGELIFATGIVNLAEAYCKTIPYEIVPGAYLRLSVSDTGCGIDKDILNRIFEPFFTTKGQGKGTGMGLPAVYGTVRSLKGAITVYSEPGHGSSFHLYFPLLENEGPICSPAVETALSEKGHGHVLLVEDEQTVSECVKKLLQLLGYTVTVCNNGMEALVFYRDSWKSVDLVILDMIMPVMGGKDTFIAMKRINPDIIALLASGYSLNGEAQSILNMGVRGFIQKPFAIAELFENISALLGKRA